ncbi:MAG: D-amino acid aminotransferase [Phycisphaeraceae bacterium]
MPATPSTMLVYLNGHFLPKDQATLSVEDRGTLFGDGVYEVLEYYDGRPFAMQGHLDRLRQSLAGIRLPAPAAVDRLPEISDELLRRNHLTHARLYWQVTRGPAPRNHLPPDEPTPTVLAIPTPIAPLNVRAPVQCWKAITHDDLRWARCCYKTLMLLPNTLAKDEARRAGCQEAILHRNGTVTEGSATNVLAVCDGALWTHPADASILHGITRAIAIDLARALGLALHETALTVEQLRAAEEVMVTGTTARVTAITHVDGHPIGAGEAGPVTTRLHETFLKQLSQQCQPAGCT